MIVQDVGAASYIREYFPGLAVHASTQMTITGRRGASFMKSQGIVRVVPARNCLWKKSEKSESIFPRIWKLKPLFTGQCVFPIQAVVFSAIIWWEEMPTEAPAPIRAGGNILLWKRKDRENICRFLKMKEAHIFLTPKTCA